MNSSLLVLAGLILTSQIASAAVLNLNCTLNQTLAPGASPSPALTGAFDLQDPAQSQIDGKTVDDAAEPDMAHAAGAEQILSLNGQQYTLSLDHTAVWIKDFATYDCAPATKSAELF